MISKLKELLDKLSFYNRNIATEEKEIRSLTIQFYKTLNAQVTAVEEKGNPAVPNAFTRVRKILDAPQKEWTWSNAYEAEQQMVNLFDDHMLKTELARRLEDAIILRRHVADWYREQFKDAKDSAARRALLLRLVNDLQWQYTLKSAQRLYARSIAKRTGVAFIFIIMVFFATISCGSYITRITTLDHYLTLLAAIAGAWGATFSMLTSLRVRLETRHLGRLRLARPWSMIIARVLVGMGAALILFYFIKSSLLQGQMFPDLNFNSSPNPAGNIINESSLSFKSQALLIVWSFLAGFSERLVPGLLAKTETGGSEQLQTGELRLVESKLPISPSTEKTNNGTKERV